jgi:hypothetical protein
VLRRCSSRGRRPNRAESYGKEPEFRSIFSLNLSVTAVYLSEAESNGINAGNHGG